MKIRRQLTVASPLTASNIAAATFDTILHRDRGDAVRSALAREFGAHEVLLTDSGTSALVLAIRAVAMAGTTIAMPAYACVDLIAAARRAEVRVRLFDLDPLTLSPDVESLKRVLAEGVSAVVVAHLYGFPADMIAVTAAASDAGVPVIEDAAQHACATIAGRRAGSFGDLTVLSFGRGKGTTSGRGGALLARSNYHGSLPRDLVATSSLGDLAVAKASWLLGRPSVYGIPASIPALHLGETVYHDASEPRGMSRAAIGLLDQTLPGMQRAANARKAIAMILRDAADRSRDVTAIRPIESGETGYLRFPILLRGVVHDSPELGIARAYPLPLSEEPEMRALLVSSEEPLHGARELAARLVTLPTHHMVRPSDLSGLAQWLQ